MNTKKFRIIIATIGLCTAFAGTSCKKFLELDPLSTWRDETFYSSAVEVEMAIAGIYSEMANDEMYGRDFNMVLESGTDETYTAASDASWAAARLGYTSSSSQVGRLWSHFYSCINLVNQLETNMDPNMFPEEQYNQYLAKARFMRGFAYFTLANWYGPVPIRLKPSSSQADNLLAASPVKQVYEQAEKDFLFASEHLLHAKEAKYVPGEPNKMAAHGLLARLYLRMGGFQPYLAPNEVDCYFDNSQQYFEKAKQQCEIIIQDGWHHIVPFSQDPNSYRNHFINYLQNRYDTRESLFEISFGNMLSLGLNVHGRIGNINGVEFVGTSGIPRGFANISASVVVYNKYTVEDARREWSIAGYRNNYSSANQRYTMTYFYDKPLHQEYGIGKYRRWEPTDIEALKVAGSMIEAPYTILNNTPGSDIDANYTSINFPILRYSDVLLMHAEAIIGGRFGTTDATAEAVNSLNIVRERAGLEPYFGSLNHDLFFRELVDERLRELCFEGLRKQDLVRWNVFREKLDELEEAVTLRSDYVETNEYHQTYLEPVKIFDKEKHFLLPYPLQEVTINTELHQRNPW